MTDHELILMPATRPAPVFALCSRGFKNCLLRARSQVQLLPGAPSHNGEPPSEADL